MRPEGRKTDKPRKTEKRDNGDGTLFSSSPSAGKADRGEGVSTSVRVLLLFLKERFSAFQKGGPAKQAELDPALDSLATLRKQRMKKLYLSVARLLFNLFAAVGLYFWLFCFEGIEDIRPVVNHVEKDGPADQAGIYVGDEITAIGGKAVTGWIDINRYIAASTTTPVAISIRREGKLSVVNLAPRIRTAKDIFGYPVTVHDAGFSGIPPVLAQVGDVADPSPAKTAGLQPGDLIVAINGNPVKDWNDLRTCVENTDRAVLSMEVRRQDETLTMTVMPTLKKIRNSMDEYVDIYRIGILSSDITLSRSHLVLIHREKVSGLLESMAATDEMAWRILASVGTGIRILFSGTQNLSDEILKRADNVRQIRTKNFLERVKQIRPFRFTEGMGGPVRISDMTEQQIRPGISHLILLVSGMMLFSALFDILSILVYGGSLLLLFQFEKRSGRPVNPFNRKLVSAVKSLILLPIRLFALYLAFALVIGIFEQTDNRFVSEGSASVREQMEASAPRTCNDPWSRQIAVFSVG